MAPFSSLSSSCSSLTVPDVADTKEGGHHGAVLVGTARYSPLPPPPPSNRSIAVSIEVGEQGRDFFPLPIQAFHQHFKPCHNATTVSDNAVLLRLLDAALRSQEETRGPRACLALAVGDSRWNCHYVLPKIALASLLACQAVINGVGQHQPPSWAARAQLPFSWPSWSGGSKSSCTPRPAKAGRLPDLQSA